MSVHVTLTSLDDPVVQPREAVECDTCGWEGVREREWGKGGRGGRGKGKRGGNG